MCRCGLSAEGSGALSDTDGGESSGGSSGYASSGGGSSSGTTTGPGSSSGGSDVDGPDPNADDAPLSLPPPGHGRRCRRATGGRGLEGREHRRLGDVLDAHDAAAHSSRSTVRLRAAFKAAFKLRPPTNPGTCSTVLGPFEGLGLCP